jgi:hypothetical protein
VDFELYTGSILIDHVMLFFFEGGYFKLATLNGPTLKNVDGILEQTFQVLQTAHERKIVTEGNSRFKVGCVSTQHRAQNSAL